LFVDTVSRAVSSIPVSEVAMRLHVCFLALPLLFPLALSAAEHDHRPTATPAADSAKSSVPWAEGTIKKLGKGTVTLAHGPIESIGMDAMTMQFAVRDPASLARFKVGDKVRFQAVMAGGEIVVERIEPAR
jgi:Cu(I)/Ag(I) efflux system periplasmic protein CusF